MKPWVRSLIGWLVAVLVVVGGVFGYLRWKKAHAVPEVHWRTVKAAKSKISAKVTATGTLSARITVQVGSQVSGRIQDIFVDFNSQVKKGQVIAKIDARLFQASVQKANANYTEAKASLVKAKANAELAQKAFERAKTLKEQGLMGQADYDTAETAVASSKADILVAQGGVDQALADLNQAKVNLDFTTIISPIDGTVLSRAVDVGQTVAASLQAPVLFTIAQDLRKIQVDTYVAEADVGKLKAGMDATFTVDAFPGKRFKGKVREVRNAAQTVQNVVTYDAVLDVDNDALELKPGMTANVTYVYAERDDVLSVPNSALRFRPPASAMPSASASGSGRAHARTWGSASASGESDPTKRTLWVLRNDQPVPVRVTTGVSDGTTTEIVDGKLQDGDDVITEYIESADAAKTSGGGGAPGGGGMRMRL